MRTWHTVNTLSPLQQIHSRLRDLTASLPDHVTLHRDGKFHVRMRKGRGKDKGGLNADGWFGENVVDEVMQNRAIRFVDHTVAPIIGGYPFPLMNASNDEIALVVIEPIPIGIALFLVGERLDISAYLQPFPSIAQTVLFEPLLIPAFDGANILIVFCTRPFMPAGDMPILDYNEHRLTEFVAFPSREFLAGRDWSANRSHHYLWKQLRIT